MIGVKQHSTLLIFIGLLFAVPVSQAEEHDYVGSKKCKKCHLKEFKSWAETKMANSFETLKPGERAEEKKAAGLDPEKDYTTDAECLPCHTVGYGKEGGFVDTETTADHAGVGCEMCHGAGGTYMQNQYMSLKNKNYKRENIVAVGMTDKITAETCAVCHNTKSPFVGDDYVFDFETRKDEGTHKKFPLKYEH
jgi:hypothetical protein